MNIINDSLEAVADAIVKRASEMPPTDEIYTLAKAASEICCADKMVSGGESFKPSSEPTYHSWFGKGK